MIISHDDRRRRREAATAKVQDATATVHGTDEHAIGTVRMPLDSPNTAPERFGAEKWSSSIHVSGIKQANGLVVCPLQHVDRRGAFEPHTHTHVKRYGGTGTHK